MNNTSLHTYLKNTTSLSQPGALLILAAEKGMEASVENLNGIATDIHYEPLKNVQDSSPKNHFGYPQRGTSCVVKALKRLVRLFPADDEHNLFHIAGKMMVYTTWGHSYPMPQHMNLELRASLAKAIFRRMDECRIPLKNLKEVAQHLVEDRQWKWISPVILRRVYQRILNQGSIQGASDWIGYLFIQSDTLAVKYVNDILNGYMQKHLPIQLVVESLKLLVESHTDMAIKKLLYEKLTENDSNIKNFQWAAVVQANRPLTVRLFGPYSPLRSVFGRLQKDRLSRFAPRT